ncbi:hypothetical protein HID58_071502 [Brassica napus]|uniref:Uncharacterized protein n=1 Tax=Brassica napus TaxID=3708 RepID=A0ABQ7Z1S5_BRANA|nr:hypothetical protein HID58_071502 [Brassica napus]
MKENTQVPSDDHSNGGRSLATIPDSSGPGQIQSCCVNPVDMDCVREKLTSGSVMVAAEENHPSGGDLLPQNPSMDSSDEAEAYHSNQTCSPRKTSASSNISSSEIIIDRESTSYSESFKFQFNGGKNCLPVNTEEQEKSEVATFLVTAKKVEKGFWYMCLWHMPHCTTIFMERTRP